MQLFLFSFQTTQRLVCLPLEGRRVFDSCKSVKVVCGEQRERGCALDGLISQNGIPALADVFELLHWHIRGKAGTLKVVGLNPAPLPKSKRQIRQEKGPRHSTTVVHRQESAVVASPLVRGCGFKSRVTPFAHDPAPKTKDKYARRPGLDASLRSVGGKKTCLVI